MSRWLFGTFRNQQLLPSTVNSNWLCRPVLSFWDRRRRSLNLPLPGKYYWACHNGIAVRFTRAYDYILPLFGTLLLVCPPEPWYRHICACICWSPLSTPPFFDIKIMSNEHCCRSPGTIVCLRVLLSSSVIRLWGTRFSSSYFWIPPVKLLPSLCLPRHR